MVALKKARKRFVTAPGRKPVSRYLYVEVRAWFSVPATTGNRAEGTLDGPISFDHVVVKASTDRQAYALGAEAMHEQQRTTPDKHNHATGQFLNDYVVKL